MSFGDNLERWARARIAPVVETYRARGWWSSVPFDGLADAAPRFADRVAVVDHTTSLTYAELDDLATDAAGTLAEQGLRRGDSLTLVTANDVPSVVAFHAAWRSGAVVVAVSQSSGAGEIAEAINRTESRVVISPAAITPASIAAATNGRLQSGSQTWTSSESLLDGAPNSRNEWKRNSPPPRSPDSPVVIMLTSGTTSRPKAVVHSPNTLRVAARNMAAVIALTPDDGFFLVSPLASITGVVQAICIAPMVGCRVILEPHFDDRASVDRVVTHRATYYGGPDVVLGRLFDEAARRGLSDLGLRGALFGGTMLDQRVLDRAEREFGMRIQRAYGSSEAPVTSATFVDDPPDVRLVDDGSPLDGVEIRIGSRSDPHELCVRGAHRALGYLDDADNEASEEDGWFTTGDLATYAHGRIRIIGRIKDIVIRNGLKVSLARVESLVAELPEVAQCAAYAVPDDDTGEHLALAIRGQPGASISFTAVCDRLLAVGLAKWMLPEEIVIWNTRFPETATGKVRRDDVASQSSNHPRLLAPRLADKTTAESVAK